MPNKTRFVIDPDRTYVVTLDDGDEVEVTGLDIVQMGYQVQKAKKLLDAFRSLEDREENEWSWW
jgi:hypothetical protein